MIKTYQYRLKDSSSKHLLNFLAGKVNYVFNYCNEASLLKFKESRKFLTEKELILLTTGSSKSLGLYASTIQNVVKEFCLRKLKAKKYKLHWRISKGTRKNLGWIPVTNQAIKVENSTLTFAGNTFKFWKSREIEGKIKSASFSENSKGQWFINLICEYEPEPTPINIHSVGIDLGLKTLVTLSTGETIENPRFLKHHEEALAKAQRAKHKKQARNIHLKIKNSRKDFLHKETTRLVNKFGIFFVGNVSSKQMIKKRNFSKSISDAGWYLFKTLLEYKVIALGRVFKEINEKYSSCTCSVCSAKTGPSGLGQLGVRNWICSNCNTPHNRDVNAAVNILNFGLGH